MNGQVGRSATSRSELYIQSTAKEKKPEAPVAG
jgi:hypothetical protein